MPTFISSASSRQSSASAAARTRRTALATSSNCFGPQGLGPVALGRGGIVVYLDDQAVRPAGCRGQSHGLDIAGHAGGVAGVHDDGQMGQLMEHGDCGQVQGVPGGGLEGADPRSHRMTFSLPLAMMYSALISSSLTVLASPA